MRSVQKMCKILSEKLIVRLFCVILRDMKSIKSIYCLLIIFLASCSNSKYPEYLTVAAELTETNPDSAVVVLKQMQERIAEESEAAYMYYRLLCVKAADRSFVEHKSDKEILEILKYYEESDNDMLLPIAYYYAGSVYRDLKDGPQAMMYFQKALDCLSSSDDNVMKARTYSQLGYILSDQYLFDEAIDMFRKSYEIDCLLKDSVGIVYNLSDIGNVFKKIEQYDSCLVYNQKAFAIAKETNDTLLIYTISNDMANAYNLKKDYNNALKYLRESMRHNRKYMQSVVYSAAIKTYYSLDMKDSVRHCYDKLMEVGNIYGKNCAYRIMAQMSLENGMRKEALDNLHMFISTSDSVNRAISAEAVAKANALYDYSLHERRRNELEIENYKIKSDIIMVSLACVVLVLSIALLMTYYKRRQNKMQKRIEELKKIKENIYRKSEQYIEENEKNIEELNKRIESADIRNRELQEELDKQKQRLILDNEIARHRMEEDRMHQKSIVASDIYHRVMRIARQEDNDAITEEEWGMVEHIVNTEYPGFSHKLKSMCRLSSHEHHICLLLKMRLTPSHIGIVTYRSRESLSSSRRRLYEKVTGKKGSPKDWDEIVMGL